MFDAARSQVCTIGSRTWIKTYGASSADEQISAIGNSSGSSGGTAVPVARPSAKA